MCMSEHMHVEARGQPQMLLSTSGAVHLVIDFFVVVAVVVFNLKQSVSSPRDPSVSASLELGLHNN